MGDLKQKFNELSQLAAVIHTWGQGAKDHMPVASKISLIFNFMTHRILTSKSKQYDALDHSAYENLLKNGPEAKGYEASIAILEKTLKAANSNSGAVLRFMDGRKARQFMPVLDNKEELRAIAAKHKYTCFKKLLR